MEPLSARATIEKLLPSLSVKKLLAIFMLMLAVSSIITGVVYSRVILAGHSTSFPLSEPRLGFQDGPVSRGTLNIIWTCASTIFTCIYVSLHLDLPYHVLGEDAQDGKTRNSPWKWVKKTWRWLEKQLCLRKLVWMGVNFVVPEVFSGIAAWEYQSAKAGVKYMEWKKRERRENREGWEKYEGWTLTHAFFADMGGFKVPDDNDPNGRILHSGVEFYKWFESEDGTIDFYHLLLEINDRSKADSLLKAYTCIQASWLVVQAVVRAIEHRPVSELEVATCGFVFCTVVAFMFWWDKPKDVQQHILLRVDRPARTYPPRDLSFFKLLWNRIKSGFSIIVCVFRSNATKPPPPKQVIPDHHSWPFNRYCGIKEIQWAFHIVGVIGAGIGAIHCALWNTQFINSNGQLLWRICCGIQITVPLIEALQPQLPGVSKTFHTINHFVVGIALCFARVVTAVLIILSFRSLPAGVYTDIDWTWSAFPHWH